MRISVAQSIRGVEDLDIGGTRIEGAREFRYLGSVVNSENKMNDKICSRLNEEIEHITPILSL